MKFNVFGQSSVVIYLGKSQIQYVMFTVIEKLLNQSPSSAVLV